MLMTKFIEQLSTSDVWPKKVDLYVRFLKVVPGTRRSIKQLSTESGMTAQCGSKVVRNLKLAGYVKLVFVGQTRHVILTKEGEDVLRGLR